MLLLDTHALVWLASDQRQLSAAGKAALRAAAGTLCVSAISGLEVALLVKRGRLELPLPVEEFMVRALRQHGVEEVPVDLSIALRSAALPGVHNDPFDRLIVATALVRNCPILSKDTILPQYPGVSVLW